MLMNVLFMFDLYSLPLLGSISPRVESSTCFVVDLSETSCLMPCAENRVSFDWYDMIF